MIALPSKTKNWTIAEYAGASSETLATDFKKTMFAVRQALKGAGFTVVRSCDGASVSASDLWTDYTKCVWNTGYPHAWIVYGWPGTSYQICFDLNTGSSSGLYIGARYSPAAGFTGGSTAARATATDEKFLGTNNGELNRWAGTLVAIFTSHVLGYSATDGSVRIFIWVSTNTTISGMMMFEHIPDSHNLADTWDKKILSIRGSTTSAAPIGDAAYLTQTSAVSPACQFMSGTTSYDGIFTYTGYGTSQLVRQLAADSQPFHPGSVYPFTPIMMVNNTHGGVLCNVPDLYWGNDVIALAKSKKALTYPNNATNRLWLQQHELIHPWRGDATLPSWGMASDEHKDGYLAALSARDIIQPSIGPWSPSAGSTIDNDATISFSVTDNLDNLARVIVIAEFTGGSHEVIHNGTAFADYYIPESTRSVIANGFLYSIARSLGWAGPDLTIRIYATDIDGNEATPTGYAFTVTDPVLPDTYPPVVSNVSPAAGTALARTDAVFFDVTDDSGVFRRIIVTATFADGVAEVVHDGDGFAARYGSTSTRTPITNGFRYRVRRTGGWPYGPTIRAYAIDPAGNENV